MTDSLFMYKTIGQRQAMEQFIKQELPEASMYLSRELHLDPDSIVSILKEKWFDRDIMSPPSHWAMAKITRAIVDEVLETMTLARSQKEHNERLLIAKEDQNADSMRTLVGRAPLRAPIPAPPLPHIARSGKRDRTTIIGRQ